MTLLLIDFRYLFQIPKVALTKLMHILVREKIDADGFYVDKNRDEIFYQGCKK